MRNRTAHSTSHGQTRTSTDAGSAFVSEIPPCAALFGNLKNLGFFTDFREQLAAFLRRVPFPTTCTFNSYRCLTAPYRYLTGSGPAFRSMFMRVLTGLTGPDPQVGGVPVSNRPPFPRNSVMNQIFQPSGATPPLYRTEPGRCSVYPRDTRRSRFYKSYLLPP